MRAVSESDLRPMSRDSPSVTRDTPTAEFQRTSLFRAGGRKATDLTRDGRRVLSLISD
jgi:hypothetical protein